MEAPILVKKKVYIAQLTLNKTSNNNGETNKKENLDFKCETKA